MNLSVMKKSVSGGILLLLLFMLIGSPVMAEEVAADPVAAAIDAA